MERSVSHTFLSHLFFFPSWVLLSLATHLSSFPLRPCDHVCESTRPRCPSALREKHCSCGCAPPAAEPRSSESNKTGLLRKELFSNPCTFIEPSSLLHVLHPFSEQFSSGEGRMVSLEILFLSFPFFSLLSGKKNVTILFLFLLWCVGVWVCVSGPTRWGSRCGLRRNSPLSKSLSVRWRRSRIGLRGVLSSSSVPSSIVCPGILPGT